MPYLFTSESVSEGHPDKVADQISDALIDNFLAFDNQSKVACETLVTTGQVVLAGEVKSKAYLDVQEIARQVNRQKQAEKQPGQAHDILLAKGGPQRSEKRGHEETPERPAVRAVLGPRGNDAGVETAACEGV